MLKGDILQEDKEYKESLICYEQVIKFDTGKSKGKLTPTALFNIAKIKIDQRDFYGAFFAFSRETNPKKYSKQQNLLKLYNDSILDLMKRKFKSGVNKLGKIIKLKDPSLEQYTINLYEYRGYGYASLENHKRAIEDFKVARATGQVDAATIYNHFISDGILLAQKLEWAKSKASFEKAQKLFPKNPEALFYKALLYIIQNTSKSEKMFSKAKSCLDQAITLKDSDSEPYYFRALLSFYKQDMLGAVPDLDLAIDKADDNEVRHFLTRGRCYAAMRLYPEAIEEFSIVLKLDSEHTDAYYYRGCCAFEMGNQSLAFHDFQEIVEKDAQNYIQHIRAGDLLMTTGQLSDALAAYNNADSL